MVLALVVLQPVRSIVLIAEPKFIQRSDSALPVAHERILGRSVDVVLPAGEIPHEIPPVHPSELEIEEEAEIGPEGRLGLIGPGNRNSLAVHVILVELDVLLVGAVHSREKHLAGSIEFHIDRTLYLLVLPIDRGPVVTRLQFVRRPEILAVQKRNGSILLS